MNNKKNIEDKYNELIQIFRFLITSTFKSPNNDVSICIKRMLNYNIKNKEICFGKETLFFDFNNYTKSFGLQLSPDIIEDLQRGEDNENESDI